MPPRGISSRQMREACATLETVVLKRQLATGAALDAQRPGGPANPDPGPLGWLRFHGVLHRYHAAQEAEPTPAIDVEAAITRAATQRPETVRLTLLDDDGQPMVVAVYPKSNRALLLLHARDVRYAAACRDYRWLQQDDSPDGRALLGRAAEAMSEQLQQCVWAVTTPGPWLPFDPHATQMAPPPWTALLAPVDIIAILLAHRRVNAEQLATLSHLVRGLTPADAGAGDGLLGWGAFVLQRADDEGVSPDVIDRDRALTAELAGLYRRAAQAEQLRAAQRRTA